MLGCNFNMLNWKNIVRALVVSGVLTIALGMASTLLFGKGHVIDPKLDWSKVDVMSYKEATKYIESHTREMSSWEVLFKDIQHWSWFHFLRGTMFMFVSIFMGCVALLWWLEKKKET